MVKGKREEKLLMALDHKNIVTYLGRADDKEHMYLVMKLYQCSLQDLLSSDRVLLEWEVAHLVEQILEATTYMHGLGVIHRLLLKKITLRL